MATMDGKTIFAGLTTGTLLVLSLDTSSMSNDAPPPIKSSTDTAAHNQNSPRLCHKRSLCAHTDVVCVG